MRIYAGLCFKSELDVDVCVQKKGACSIHVHAELYVYVDSCDVHTCRVVYQV